ncbi:flagellar protein FliT [Mixta calida]|uniref:flagellar protein FliT n=1 Tax=Mixta calida TaxID=665913 RepID=UPI003CF1CBF2
MNKLINKDYAAIYQINQTMLLMARQGEWDDFVTLAENYVVTLGAALEQIPETLSEEEKMEIGSLLMALQNNEAEINRVLEARLDTLRKGITSLSHGKKCSQAYTNQVISPFQ